MPTANRSELLKNTLTMILAGGQGERLHPLTRNQAKPAVPFGGMYRIIDSQKIGYYFIYTFFFSCIGTTSL